MQILYEDDDVLVVNKPAGIAVHGGPNVSGQTVADYFKDKITDSDKERSGIVHRLDKDTSGVIIMAKNPQAKKFLQKQFKDRTVQKTYIALVRGKPKHPEAILDWPIGRNPKNPLKQAVVGQGKSAVSHYKTLQEFNGYTLLEVMPKSGRTHQIRVHLSHLGHPVVGDRVYGTDEPKLNRYFLHAKKLQIVLPSGEQHDFESELPTELSEYLVGLK